MCAGLLVSCCCLFCICSGDSNFLSCSYVFHSKLLFRLQLKIVNFHCLHRRQPRPIRAWRLCTNVHGLDAGKPFLPPPESFVMFERSILGKLSLNLSRASVGIITGWLWWKDLYNNFFDLTSIQFIRSIRFASVVVITGISKLLRKFCSFTPLIKITKIIRNARLSYKLVLQRTEYLTDK